MGGMGTSLQTTNPTIVSAFESALCYTRPSSFSSYSPFSAVAWNLLRSRQLRREQAGQLRRSQSRSGLSRPLGDF